MNKQWATKCVAFFLVMLSALTLCLCPILAAEPRVLMEGLQLDLIAKEPQIVTPVGIAFDTQGNLLVIESHTHQRPDQYEGPKGDRVRMLADSNGDGTLDQWATFAEGFRHAMNLLVAGRGRVYVVTRASVILLIDEDLDGKADRQQSILQLETEVDYPHNALSGIALLGEDLLIGLGENSGGAYRLVGSDGSSYSDHGGVGTVFRCRADGKNLRRYCNGFWNPFSICTLPGGHVFLVDNDPDASPPCRLIHAVETGDYGHRYEYSRAGTHPLQAWNGELPGTLPMLAGTGEAPCAVVPHRGYLWVTSWGDHRLERYRLTPNGATFAAEQAIAVQGDTDFRPTGCAVAPDGSLYFADWVSHSYPVHGEGRIWRMSFTEKSAEPIPVDHEAVDLSINLRESDSPDPFECQLFVQRLAQRVKSPLADTRPTVQGTTPLERLAHAQAYRWTRQPVDDQQLRHLLNDSSPQVRTYALRWIADDRRVALREDVASVVDELSRYSRAAFGGALGGLHDYPLEREYLALLSTLEWLDNEPKFRASTLSDGLMVRELKNSGRSPELHAIALRLVTPDNEFLTLDRLRGYLNSSHAPLRLEAIRTLALQSNPDRFPLLIEIAQDQSRSKLIRAEAVAGLAATEQHLTVLEELTKDSSHIVGKEAKGVLRLLGKLPVRHESKPPAEDLTSWEKLMASGGTPSAGRRLFFSSRGPQCATCHQHSGRGGAIGPDLSRIHMSNTRRQLLASILQPSREIAPHYQSWVLSTHDGKTHVALRLHKSGDGGQEIYADSAGKQFSLSGEEIEFRQASEISIMPAGLEKTLSVAQLRDLVAFLSDGK